MQAASLMWPAKLAASTQFMAPTQSAAPTQVAPDVSTPSPAWAASEAQRMVHAALSMRPAKSAAPTQSAHELFPRPAPAASPTSPLPSSSASHTVEPRLTQTGLEPAAPDVSAALLQAAPPLSLLAKLRTAAAASTLRTWRCSSSNRALRQAAEPDARLRQVPPEKKARQRNWQTDVLLRCSAAAFVLSWTACMAQIRSTERRHRHPLHNNAGDFTSTSAIGRRQRFPPVDKMCGDYKRKQWGMGKAELGTGGDSVLGLQRRLGSGA
jgi:hypothetical protein